MNLKISLILFILIFQISCQKNNNSEDSKIAPDQNSSEIVNEELKQKLLNIKIPDSTNTFTFTKVEASEWVRSMIYQAIAPAQGVTGSEDVRHYFTFPEEDFTFKNLSIDAKGSVSGSCKGVASGAGQKKLPKKTISLKLESNCNNLTYYINPFSLSGNFVFTAHYTFENNLSEEGGNFTGGFSLLKIEQPQFGARSSFELAYSLKKSSNHLIVHEEEDTVIETSGTVLFGTNNQNFNCSVSGPLYKFNIICSEFDL